MRVRFEYDAPVRRSGGKVINPVDELDASTGTNPTALRTPLSALATVGIWPTRVWELDSSEAIKRAAREGLGIAFLSRYAVAEEIERGELDYFRIAGRPLLDRNLHIARLARRPLSASERGFVATLTRCCAKNAAYRNVPRVMIYFRSWAR